MNRVIKYLISDGTIVGKIETVDYVDFPVPGQDYIDYVGTIDWYAITPAAHKVDLVNFIVIPK